MLKGAVLRYLVSDALSLTGNSIAGVVLPLVLLARTGDALAAGSLALICAIPQFICGILGGALLDRANREVEQRGLRPHLGRERRAPPHCRRHMGLVIWLVRRPGAARRHGHRRAPLHRR